MYMKYTYSNVHILKYKTLKILKMSVIPLQHVGRKGPTIQEILINQTSSELFKFI